MGERAEREAVDLDAVQQRHDQAAKHRRVHTRQEHEDLLATARDVPALIAELAAAREQLQAAHRARGLVRAARAEVLRLLGGKPVPASVAKALRRAHTDLDEAVALTGTQPSTPHRAGTP